MRDWKIALREYIGDYYTDYLKGKIHQVKEDIAII